MRIVHAGLACALIAGCAKAPETIQPKFASAAPYRTLECPALMEERRRVHTELTRIEALQKENHEADGASMAVGMILFWPALIALAATTDRSEMIAAMKGERDAMDIVMREKACVPPGVTIPGVTPDPPPPPAPPKPSTADQSTWR